MNPTSPGWFPSQTHPDEELFWDGERWTGATRRTDSQNHVDDREPLADGTLDAHRGDATSQERPTRPLSRRARVIVGIAAAVLLLGGGVTAVASVQAREQAAAQAAEEREAGERYAARIAANEKAAADRDAAAEAQEREGRDLTVTEIEGSVKTMADDNAAEGLHEAVIAVSCNPVDGGSTDDLTDQTTAFDCFAATTDNADGTQSGYYYNATVNWNTSEYTYGYGRNG